MGHKRRRNRPQTGEVVPHRPRLASKYHHDGPKEVIRPG